jgi:hypothetical protein
MSNPYRQYSGQYEKADRDFQNGDLVVFVGPPDEEYQPGMIASPTEHMLHHCKGRICIGKSEDILVFPDEPDSNLYWVRFEDDTQPVRQIPATWIVKTEDLQV